MPSKVLFILSSHDKLINGKPTGWYVVYRALRLTGTAEAAHPYEEVTKAGHEVVFASPKGGKAPLDPGSAEAFKDDPICKAFQADEKVQKAIADTVALKDVKTSDYAAVFIVGGHGPMFESEDKEVIRVAGEAYESSVLGAVCHGPGALVNVKRKDGKSIFEGAEVTGFSDAEEDQVGLTDQVPFLLETRVKELGAKYSKASDAWGAHVKVANNGRFLTGQNPNSATPLGAELVKAIKASA